MVYLYDACDQISDFCHPQLLRKMRRKISWTDGRTDRGKTVYPPPPSGSVGIIKTWLTVPVCYIIEDNFRLRLFCNFKNVFLPSKVHGELEIAVQIDGFMVFNTIFNNISVISWKWVLLVEEIWENHQTVASHWQTLYHIMLYRVHLTMNGVQTHNFSSDRH